MSDLLVHHVWIPDQGETEEDAHEVAASSGHDAVVAHVKRREQRECEYLVASGGTEEVHVRTPDSRHEVWSVTGEMCPHYVATRKT